MLRALCSDGFYLLGLDAENLRRLGEGDTLIVDLTEMGGKDKIRIIVGDTVESMRAMFEAAQGPIYLLRLSKGRINEYTRINP